MNVESVSAPTAKAILRELVQHGLPPQGHARYLTVGFDKTLHTIESELLAQTLPQGYGAVRVILGLNGNGKTHLCRDILERARERNYATAELDLSPGRELGTPAALYGQIAASLGLATSSIGMIGIDKLLHATPDARQRLKEKPLTQSYRMAAMALADPEISRERRAAFASWIRGESVSSQDRKTLGLKERLTDRNAMRWIKNLIYTTQALGSTGLVVVLDETETTLDAAQRRLTARLTVMLSILNGTASGAFPGTLFLITGITNTFTANWEALKPIRQRLAPHLLIPEGSAPNPRGIRIHTDGTGELPPEKWMRDASERILTLAHVAGQSRTPRKDQLIDELVARTSKSAASLNKRSFIREAARIADER